MDVSSDLCDFEPPEDITVALPELCRSGPVRILARTIREGLVRDVPHEITSKRMAKLANRLRAVGCEVDAVLNHCRRCPQHYPDCWVLGLVLEDEFGEETPATSGPVRRRVDRAADGIIRLQLLVLAVGVLVLLVCGVISLIRGFTS